MNFDHQIFRKNLFFFLCFLIGFFGRTYGLFSPWGSKDHYNRGGPMTQAYVLCYETEGREGSFGRAHFGCRARFDVMHNPLLKTLSQDLQRKARTISQRQNEQFQMGPPDPEFWKHHPSTYVQGQYLLTRIFGNHEWVTRLFTLIFSLSNILLIFWLGRSLWPNDPSMALMAASFQSLFLAGMYLGTHADIPGEYNATFLILATIAAVRGRWGLASLAVVLAGWFDWPGFLALFPLLALAAHQKVSRLRLVFMTLFVGLCGGVLAWWVQGFTNPAQFFISKLSHSGHVSSNADFFDRLGSFLSFVKTSLSSHSRLLSPLFALFAAIELCKGSARGLFLRESWRKGLSSYQKAIFLIGGTGLIMSILGHEYVRVHFFWFMISIPCFALLCASFSRDFLFQTESVFHRRLGIFLGLLFLALYPYGIFQSHRIHDFINSAGFVVTSLIFLFYRIDRLKQHFAWLVLAVGVFNFSQTINYRSEPEDLNVGFCREALREFLLTEQTVHRQHRRIDAHYQYYCRGIPIVYTEGS